MRRFLVPVVALVLFAAAGAAVAQNYSPRQYYGNLQKHPSANYSYRPYYYKPTPTYSGYKHHYAVYVPSKPQHVYFYNPYSKQYWGRCPASNGGKAQYSLLAEKDRKGNLNDIPESAFPAPGALPALPESNDGATLELPPDDLPAADTLPTGR